MTPAGAVSAAERSPSAERLASLVVPLAACIRDRFGVEVRFVDVPPPFLGDLDGAEIRLQAGHEPGPTLFTLAHLFGHTVQWNLSERARHLGGRADGRYTPEELAEIEDYERVASRYGLELLHRIGVRDLDAWLSDFAAADLAYLEHFYRTGERLPLAEVWREGQPLLAPLAIPAFTPRRYKLRWDGVVV